MTTFAQRVKEIEERIQKYKEVKPKTLNIAMIKGETIEKEEIKLSALKEGYQLGKEDAKKECLDKIDRFEYTGGGVDTVLKELKEEMSK